MAQENINQALAPFVVPATALHQDPKNRRKHSDKNLKAIADSLASVGQQKPVVVDAAGKIVAGNGTFQAATRLLGWARIAAVTFDGDDVKAKAFAIADNRTGELASWDFEGLAEDAKAGVDMIGWDGHELEPLLEANWAPPPVDASQDDLASAGRDEGTPGGTTTATPGQDATGAKEGHLFGAFTESEQSWVLKALALARGQWAEVTTNEQALARLCKEYAEALADES